MKRFLVVTPIIFLLACGARSSIPGGPGSAGQCPSPLEPDLPTPPTPPAVPGCFEDHDGKWVQVPCDCDVPIINTTASTTSIEIHLEADVFPSLTTSPTVEIGFPDPDGAFYQTWVNEVGSGVSFVVTATAGITTVRLGAKDVKLSAVPLDACRNDMAHASVSGAEAGNKLDVHVSSTNGDDSIEASCVYHQHPQL